jgi:tetratricopeptide (TPR) repeat protein
MSGLADVLRELGKPDEAIAARRQALELSEALAKDYPLTRERQADLAGDLYEMGALLVNKAEHQEAEPYLQRALEIRSKLASAGWNTPNNRSQLGAILNNLALVLQDRGQFDEARQRLQQAIVHQQAALEAEPDQPVHRRFLKFHRANLAVVSVHLGRASEAEKVLSDLVCTSPEDYIFKLDLLSWCLRNAEEATALPREDRDSVTRKLIQTAKEIINEAIQRWGDKSEVLNQAAWLLVAWDFPDLRDPERARRVAQKATELAPRVGGYWNTLGVAQYRAGDWKAAVAALERSMELSKEGSGSDWFFLAMAHWQLGDHLRARSWYDKAVAWMDTNRTTDDELRRFRAEASALFGVPELPADVFARP